MTEIPAGGGTIPKKIKTNIPKTSSTRRQFAEIYEIQGTRYLMELFLIWHSPVTISISMEMELWLFRLVFFFLFWGISLPLSPDVIFHVLFFLLSILAGQDAINLNPIIRQSGSGQGPLSEVSILSYLYRFSSFCIEINTISSLLFWGKSGGEQRLPFKRADHFLSPSP